MNPDALMQRREFNDAVRRRIREIAASLDLPGQEIKPAPTLKTYQIAKFLGKHGVNAYWLLESRGRVFKTGAGASRAAPGA